MPWDYRILGLLLALPSPSTPQLSLGAGHSPWEKSQAWIFSSTQQTASSPSFLWERAAAQARGEGRSTSPHDTPYTGLLWEWSSH